MTRTETGIPGAIEIDAGRLWGPQAERACLLLRIGCDKAVRVGKLALAENLTCATLPSSLGSWSRPTSTAGRRRRG